MATIHDQARALSLGIGDVYHDLDDRAHYYRVTGLIRDGLLVTVIRDNRTTASYHMAAPVVIVHYAGDSTTPPATDAEFDC